VLTRELYYELPEELIAQRSAEPRDSSRLMVVDVRERSIAHHAFRDLPHFLGPGDTVVVNETKVLPARVLARRPGGGASELLFLRSLNADGGYGGDVWEVLVRPSRRLRGGMVLSAGGDKLRIVKPLEEGRWVVAGENVRGMLRRRGHAPLPPYIKATPEAEREYQTVYARDEGSAAAPTAGFHFTERVLGEVEEAGARVSRVTLHVGVGTFSPVRTERLEDHRMHPEYYRVPAETVRALEDTRRVLAVGTTVARTLESWAATGALEGESELFI
jgi:S-adenosylmethionine:tRNA ribosyltransferase-isomerase